MIPESTTYEHDWVVPEVSPPAPRTPLLLGILLVLALAVGANAAIDSALGSWRAQEVAMAQAREWPSRPLPLEWRWSPPTVKVDHMFRQRR